MTLHYIILTHRYPDQLGVLVRRLDAPGVHFHVHLERTTEQAPFEAELAGMPNVTFVAPRETSPVGDIGIVKATLHALRSVAAQGEEGRCVLLSGQCYPIRSNAAIREWYAAHPHTVCMDLHEPPTPATRTDGFVKTLDTMRQRVELYKFNHSTARGGYFLLPPLCSAAFWSAPRRHFAQLRYLLPRTQRSLWRLLRARRMPPYVQLYYGSQWWSMPVAVVRRVLHFVDEHPEYLAFHEDSLLPDEMFFQGALMALKARDPGLELLPSNTYVDWHATERPRPPVMRAQRLEQLLAMPPHVLFARKFDRTVDADIFRLLDERVGA